MLKTVLSVALLTLVAYSLEWPAVWQSISRLSWWSLPVAVALQVGAFVIGAFRWHMLLSLQGLPYRPIQIMRPYFIGAFFNNFLPSSTGGDVYRIYHVHDGQHGAAAAFSPVITERILGLTTLVLIASISFLFYRGGNPVVTQVAYGAIAFLGALLCFHIALGTPRLYWPLHRFLERWDANRFTAGILKVSEASHEYFKRPMIVLRVMILSALMQFVIIVLFWVLGAGIASILPFTIYMLIVPLVLVAAGIPITVGGLGVREAVAVSLFASVGMPQADAAAIAILFIPVLLLSSLPGLFFFLAKRTTAPKS